MYSTFWKISRKTQNFLSIFSEKTNKFPVKRNRLPNLIAKISGRFTVMVEIVRIRFWLNDADPSLTNNVKRY
jgi:hypothetical protein